MLAFGGPLPMPPEPAPVKKKGEERGEEKNEEKSSVRSAVLGFLASRREKNSTEGTVRAYRDNLEAFEESLRKKGITALDRITEEIATQWIAGADGQYTIRTRIARRSRLAAWFNWAVRRELIRRSPLVHTSVRAPKSHAKTPFSPEEVQRMFALVPAATPLARAAFLTMIYSGMRLIDFVCLRRDSLNFDTRLLTFSPVKSRFRTIITMKLNADACEAIRAADRGDRDFFFLPPGRDYSAALDAVRDEGDFLSALPVRPHTCTNRVRRLLKKYFFTPAGIIKQEPHRLRSTYAVTQIKRGLDVHTVAKLLGHSSIAVTERAYMAVLADHRSRIAEANEGLSYAA